MKEKFSKIPATTFQNLGINAGMVLSAFNPTAGTFNQSDIIGATSGGVTFNAAPEYLDFGEDIDNCPKNTKELKRISDWTITLSGTFVTMNAALAERMAAAADNTDGHVIPRDVLNITKDFRDLWFVCDYSDVNTGAGAGFLAIHISNALSTGGFQLQTADKEKGKFSFEFTAHYSIDAQDTVPFEIYIMTGGDAPYVALNTPKATVIDEETITLTATTYPAGSTVTWASSDTDVATVSGGVVTGKSVGSTIISASITENTTTYTDVCVVTVVAAPPSNI